LLLTGWLKCGLPLQRKLHWLACALGGGIWMLNDNPVIWLENPLQLSKLAWLPGILWAYQKAIDERGPGYVAVGGLLLGRSIVGSQAQFILATGLVLRICGMNANVWDRYTQGQRSLWTQRPLFIVGIIACGLGAIMLILVGEFAAYSQRVRFTAETVPGRKLLW
jgi:hypothetical protein